VQGTERRSYWRSRAPLFAVAAGGNHFLAALDPQERALLQQHLHRIYLPQDAVLFAAGDSIETVYFLHEGLVSLVVDLTGQTIEAAMVGLDGLVGGSSALAGEISLSRAVIKIGGAALAIDSAIFRAAVEQSPTLRARVSRYEQFLFAQAQQSAACNAAHSLEARLARCLLRCRDLHRNAELPLTQEHLAETLGVQRSSVSQTANTLQQAGLIQYRRGRIGILNIDELKSRACECYAMLCAHSERLVDRVPTPDGS
jgi:CRP-like cAMP-binding protein